MADAYLLILHVLKKSPRSCINKNHSLFYFSFHKGRVHYASPSPFPPPRMEINIAILWEKKREKRKREKISETDLERESP